MIIHLQEKECWVQDINDPTLMRLQKESLHHAQQHMETGHLTKSLPPWATSSGAHP